MGKGLHEHDDVEKSQKPKPPVDAVATDAYWRAHARQIRWPCPVCVGYVGVSGTYIGEVESIQYSVLPRPMQPLVGDSGIRIPFPRFGSRQIPTVGRPPPLVEKNATRAARRGA